MHLTNISCSKYSLPRHMYFISRIFPAQFLLLKSLLVSKGRHRLGQCRASFMQGISPAAFSVRFRLGTSHRIHRREAPHRRPLLFPTTSTLSFGARAFDFYSIVLRFLFGLELFLSADLLVWKQAFLHRQNGYYGTKYFPQILLSPI